MNEHNNVSETLFIDEFGRLAYFLQSVEATGVYYVDGIVQLEKPQTDNQKELCLLLTTE